MQKMLAGIRRFQTEIYPAMQPLFEELAGGQHPEVLLITCSDSRVVPSLLTQSGPGELFVLRNAGNLVPSYSAGGGGEAATIEYAVKALRVKDIIVCGHSQCGAVKALITPGGADSLPAVQQWLLHARRTLEILETRHADIQDPAQRLARAIEVNAVVQMQNVCSHPAVAEALEQGTVRVHAWVYDFITGQVQAYDPRSETFEPLDGFSPAV